MQIRSNSYSIAEIIDMVDRRALVVNRQYQRGSGLWPNGPRSYFIDTILEGFPFPKIYFYEYIDRKEGQIRREVVDGQQRVFTIIDFCKNEFAISGDSQFAGLRFADLDDDIKGSFLAYPVSADVIGNATQAEILQMFRRMNAYTLPLNEAEKRHSSHFGEFKWFINEMADHLDSFFVEYGVFTSRQIVRMADAEFLAEVSLAMESGLVSTSPSQLNKLYYKYDATFAEKQEFQEKISSSFDYITSNFSNLRNTFLMKPYALQTLILALIFNRYGIPAIASQVQAESAGVFSTDPGRSAVELQALAEAHEGKELDGPYSEYVWGASGGTNRAPRRAVRFKYVLSALGSHVGDLLDGSLAR
ncbi:DUF262 domain-containing protein [Mesorhizobium sp. M0207]|uniref:DUF262 domain-containing protein n=1 Tax=Mesorhizobium sp. M0207 TaxID=2956915 RepID=UPI0033358E40